MSWRNVGGTPGGLGPFLWGFVMAVGGGYMLVSRVTVSSGGWALWGYNAFGLSLLPFLIGIGLLAYGGRSLAGWLLTAAGLTIIFAGILMNLHIYFSPTSLFDTLAMLALLAAGLGLMARALQPMRGSAP
ncbi:hypothetical protein D0B54_15125 [Solimonas sp. K1W22B-7]|uniref:hypothetical protein n=1 Tax=Solimonas sp. K1W22B-7 TaxID=2303331 RepID=UPI000E32F756|nr:hypothetical protein [Solimonas sp. K1W22B-7]AXQ29928.1 hypothetical protein D0B54_15125 [Solimonas sp. K1W22B-7]